MKKYLLTFCRIFLLIGIVQLAGCQKLIDGVFRRPVDNPTTCKITSIDYQLYDYPPTHADFYNNRLGDPDSVIFTSSPTYGTARYFYYIYDQRFRLIGFNAYNDRNPDDYFFKHTYVYSNAGVITADTVRTRQDGVEQTFKFELQYDSKGRVIAETGYLLKSNREPEPITEPFTTLYNYDAQGNLSVISISGSSSNQIAYDTLSISFLRTSNILTFTERNYSKNNDVNGGFRDVNEQLLPTGFFYAPFEFMTTKWGLIQRTRPQLITYGCK